MISLLCALLLAIAALSHDPNPTARRVREWRKDRLRLNPRLRLK